MNKQDLISEATKSKIKDAIYDMKVLTEDGYHPSDALDKVASEYDLSEYQIKLAAVGYNTGVSAELRERGRCLTEKLGTAPLADADAVIKKHASSKETVCPGCKKSKCECKTASVYERDLDTDFSGSSLRVKTAFYEPAVKVRNTAKLGQDTNRIAIAYSDIKKTAAEQTRQLENFKAAFDNRSAVIEKHLSSLSYDKKYALKLAAADEDKIFFGELKSVPKTACPVTDKDRVFLEYLSDTRNIGVKIANGLAFAASLPAAAIKATGAFERGIPESAAQDYGINKPSTRQKIDNSVRRSLLNEMMYSDPITSTYDEKEVEKAFKEISANLPHVSSNTLLLKDAVRQSLAKGGLGSYDLAPLMQNEFNYSQRENTLKTLELARKKLDQQVKAQGDTNRDSYRKYKLLKERAEKDKQKPEVPQK